MAKKKKYDEPPAKASLQWLVTFSDLLMLLITFFVLLISMSSMDAKKLKVTFGFFMGAMANLESGSGYSGITKKTMVESRYHPAFDVVKSSNRKNVGSSEAELERMKVIVGLSKALVEKLRVMHTDTVKGTKGLRPMDARVKELLGGTVPIEVVRRKESLEFKIHMGLLFAEGTAKLRPLSKKLMARVQRFVRNGHVLQRVEAPVAENGVSSRVFSKWDLAAWRSALLVRRLAANKAGVAASVVSQRDHKYMRLLLVKSDQAG
jgi:flagellar motor protein MotB